MNPPKIGLSLTHKGWGIVTDQKAGTGIKGLFALSGVWRADDAAARGTELRQVWLEHHLSYKALVAIPVLDLFWSILEIPPVPDLEITSTIRATWELLQGNEGYLLAYEIIERREKIRLKAGAISKEEIKLWLEIVESAGIDPEGLILQAQAVSEAFFQQEQPVIFVDIMKSMIEMGVAHSGSPVQLRTFPWDAQDFDEVKEAVSFTLHAWSMNDSNTPEELVILRNYTGDVPDELPVEWDELNIRISKGEDCFHGDLSLIAAYGAYLTGNSTGVIWHPRIAGIEQREKTKTMLISATALLIFLVGTYLFYQARVKKEEVQNEWIKENIGLYHSLNAIISEDERSETKLSMKKNQWEKRNYYSFYLDQWYKTVPPETVLTSWTMDGMRVLEISGRTPSIASLLERLEKNRAFSKLTISGPVYRNPKGWDEFRLSGRLIMGEEDQYENRTGK